MPDMIFQIKSSMGIQDYGSLSFSLQEFVDVEEKIERKTEQEREQVMRQLTTTDLGKEERVFGKVSFVYARAMQQ